MAKWKKEMSTEQMRVREHFRSDVAAAVLDAESDIFFNAHFKLCMRQAME